MAETNLVMIKKNQHATKIENSNCDETKNSNSDETKNSNSDNIHKLK